ncbi:MAG: RNA 2',3'-cyclic phosphodiesterase [Thermoprotei archaeon]|nr:MAG: RNA 2',3'-cyclic phosphodiesterase [Thermoprotei archaeon]RLF19715.1 MAG: RNA 2',3'-cyclic phosphodiesterase [Thermoprotei archaeon]
MERIRSFIAIDIEKGDVLDKIIRIQEDMKGTGAIFKPVERENIHLTIRFLGEIPVRTLEMVKEIMSKVKFSKFKMELKGIGAFPTLGRPRVIWIGISEGSEQVIQIYNQIEGELRRIGFPKERESFIPHVTIARVKRYTPALIKYLRDLHEIEIGEVEVDKIRLKKSTLTSRGPIYETLYEVYAQ